MASPGLCWLFKSVTTIEDQRFFDYSWTRPVTSEFRVEFGAIMAQRTLKQLVGWRSIEAKAGVHTSGEGEKHVTRCQCERTGLDTHAQECS